MLMYKNRPTFKGVPVNWEPVPEGHTHDEVAFLYREATDEEIAKYTPDQSGPRARLVELVGEESIQVWIRMGYEYVRRGDNFYPNNWYITHERCGFPAHELIFEEGYPDLYADTEFLRYNLKESTDD